MQKLRKWVLLLSLALLVFGGTILSGCDNDNNIKLELSKTNVEITLGENDNTDVVQAVVTDAKTMEVVVDCDSQDIVVTSKYKGEGVTDITVKALRQCSNVDVMVKGAKVTKTFRVSVFAPISSIVPKQDTYYIEYNQPNGGRYQLSNNLVELFPEGTSQTGIKYALASEINGVSIVNNYLVIEPNLDVVPNGIDVEVISVYNESVKTTLHFEIIKSIDVSLVEIKEDNNVDAKLEYNIPRNNSNKNQLLLKVVVPYSVSNKLLNVKPVYLYGDMGLNVDEQIVLNDVQNQVYEYSFKFGFLQTQKTGTITDKVWFELSYVDFPEIKSSTANKVDEDGNHTGIITLTAYDEITGISVSVNDVNVTNDQFNLYTSYSNSKGLKIKFEAIPFTAINANFTLSVDSRDLTYISIKDENGNELNGQFVNGKYEFASGKVFYLIAKQSEANKVIPLTVTSSSEDKANTITRIISLSLKEGVRTFGFGTGADIESEKTYYFENKSSLDDNQEEQYLNERDILFTVAPASIEIDNLSVIIDGDNVFTVGRVQLVSNEGNEAVYKIHVVAVNGAVGEGTLVLRFESGQQIKANIKVIERLTEANIDVDLVNFVSSAVGKMSYDNNGVLNYIAIKNGRMVPLKFTSNMSSDVSFEFFDRELLRNDDVYDEDSTYVKFNTMDYTELNMSQTSTIINTETLRANDYLTTIKLGKVWVKATFIGSMLNENYELISCEIDRYFLVEVYNPVQTLTLSDKVIELYAYNEVGEKNKSLSRYTFTIKLNDSNSLATYDRVYFAESPDYESGRIIDAENPYEFFPPLYDDAQLVIEKLDNSYLVTANYRIQDANNTITMYVFANDIGGTLTHYVKAISFVIKQAQRVENIVPTNVDIVNDEYNLYLSAKSISKEYNDNNFKIINNVLPENALVKDVSYIFYPDNGTRNDIITISADGLVSVTGEDGGKGTIVIVPTDAILLDENGNTYYRENTPFARIKLTVADGKSRETSIRVTEIGQIKNQNLHYTIIANLTINTKLFEKFNGGLYGKQLNSNYTVTLTLNSGLFDEIGEDGIIEDFDIVCNVSNTSGAIAGINNGKISNISIDSYSQEKYSLVQNDSEYVGGFVGQNNGTISNVTFQGSISGDNNLSTVGGIAGRNTGLIENSKVIFYDLKSDSNQMFMQGNLCAGLVGELDGQGIITKSYAFNFGKNNSIINDANIVGIVGKINSSNAKVAECFANLGVSQSIFGELSQNIDDKKVIKDSYVTYKNNDAYEFNYYMTRQNGQILSGIATDTNQIYSGVRFGSSEIWLNDNNTEQNYGYPYLRNVKRVVPVTADELATLKIQRTNLSFKQDEDNAILFVNKTIQSLTERDNYALSLKNTISLLDLFGISSVYGLNIETNSNILTLTNGTLQINNIGDATLTIYSKYDRSIDPITINIKVIYNTNNFAISYNDYVLPSGYTIGLKKGTTQKFISSLDEYVVLNQTIFTLQNNDFDVVFENKDDENKLNNVVGSKIGTHLISINSDDAINMSVYLTLNGLEDKFAKILKNETLKNLTLQPLQGPNSIAISVKEVNMSASDSLEFQININSDVADENLACEIFDENGVKIFSQDSSNLILNQSNDLGLFNSYVYSRYTNNGVTYYDLSIELNKNKLSSINSSYYIVRFYANNIYSSVYVDLKITVIDQEIIRIDVNNYAFREVSGNNGERYNYYPTNTISTNKASLLDIMIYPSYAGFEYITVTSEPVNGQKLALLSMRKGDEEGDSSAYFADKLMNFEFIENGVKILKNSSDLENEISRFYVRTVASSDIKTNTIFNVYINVYNKYDEVVYTQVYSLLVNPPTKPGLSIDGQQDTYFALLGDTLTVQIIKEKSQTLKNNYKLSTIIDGTEVTTGYGTVSFNNDWQDVDAQYEKATFTINLSKNSLKNVTFTVETSRVINGKEEVVTSQMLIYVIPFDIDVENTSIKNSNSKDKAFGDIYFEHELDFDFAGKFTENGETEFNKFISQNYYYYNSQNEFSINQNSRNSSKAKVLRTNLYYVNGDIKTSIYNSTTNRYIENNIVEFSEVGEGNDAVLHYIGKTIGSQDMLLEIPVHMPDGNDIIYKYYFTIEIKAELNDDEPVQIYTADEFLAIFNSESEEHYILMRDIRLYEFTPISSTSSVASLDGNGFTISIVSFAQGISNFTLFENIDSNTLLKNIRLNIYNIGTINVDSSQISEINVAPMAINNNGIITNSEVVNYFDVRADVRQQSTGILITTDSTTKVTAKTAGFVIYNNGTITNSRVGGTLLNVYTVDKTGYISRTQKYSYSYGGNSSNYDLPVFTISSFGEIAGFVYENNGSITSSFASNIRIVNNSQINYTTITSGFAINNNGTISMSYSKGVKSALTDIHATKFGIETSGIATGFVYQNKGSISDCYSNINLTNLQNNPGRSSAGFVYSNTQGGKVKNSLSLSRIISSTTTQMNFSGVDELGNYISDKDSIINSYYYDQVAMGSDTTLIQKAYGESASSVSSVIIEDYFYGFNFASSNNDGIWRMTSQGPDIISANNIAVSLRYTSKESENLAKPKTAYVDEFAYGSVNNPILIRNAKDFNEAFSGTANKSVDRFVDDSTKTTVFGNYRLINDIDFHDLSVDSGKYDLTSSTKTLSGNYNTKATGKFDGNGFTINNFALTDSGNNTSLDSFGLFSKLEGGALVINLNVIVGDQNNEKEIFGIEAKNIENVGTIAGQIVDSKIINVNVSALDNTDNVTVRGKNVVGGIVGLVKGESHLFNDTITNVNVTSAYYPTAISNASTSFDNEIKLYNRYSRFGDNTKISYAGGIAGIIDYYTAQTKDNYKFTEVTVISNATSVALKNLGNMIITGGTVGGIVGYVGSQTTMQDIQFMPYSRTTADYSKQGLYSYNGFAGGIAGINKGYLRQVRSENDNVNIFADEENDLTLQQLIEKNSLSYYTQENGKYNYETTEYELGNKKLFDNSSYSPIAIGGLVGLQESGKIEKSYSKLNVVNSNAQIAGGVVGIVSNIASGKIDNDATKITEVYATGDVRGKEYTAGIVGIDLNNDDTKVVVLERVNALNLWGSWIFDENISKTNINPVLNKNYSDDEAVIRESYRLDQNYPFSSSTRQASLWTGYKETQTSVDDKYAEDYDFGERFDKIFFANNWDANTWQRDTTELYPHMVFGYFDKTIKIRNQRDIEKLRTSFSAGKVTFIIEPEIDGINDCYKAKKEYFITINRYIVPIVGFSNVLRGGEDPEATYGFVFKVDQTRALFETTLGATFSNFVVKYDNNKTQTSSLNRTAIWVRTANDTSFNNLSFVNAKINESNNSNLNVGILCAVAKGSCKFNNISFTQCEINVNSDTNSVSAGMLFGEGKFDFDENPSINVSLVYSNKISITSIRNSSTNIDSYIGLVFGQLDSVSYSTDMNISVNIGLGNEIKLGTQNNSSNEGPKFTRISVGSLFGYVKHSKVGLLSDNDNEINLPNIIIPSISNSHIGLIAGQSANSTFEKFSFVPNISMGNELFQDNLFGGIVGYSTNSRFTNLTIGNYRQIEGAKSENQGSINILNTSGKNYIGNISGRMESSSEISDVNIYSSLSVNLPEENLEDNVILYIGGISGDIKNSIVNADSTEETKNSNAIVRVYGDINIVVPENLKLINNPEMYIGGAFGFVNSSKIYNCYTTGNIEINLNKNHQAQEMMLLYTSGLVAYLNDSDDASELYNNDASELYNNIVAGNIYPLGIIYDKSLTSYKDFFYGGIVAKINKDNANVENPNILHNYSINTLYNRKDNKLSNNYYVNAIIGEGSVNNISKTEDYNMYSNVYTLCTDKQTTFASNVTLESLFDVQIKDKLNPSIDGKQYFVEGTKINYIEWNSSDRTTLDNEIKDQYIYINGTIKLSAQKPIKLTNAVIVSDGGILRLEENNNSSVNIAPFEMIDETSFVSGIVTSSLIVNTNTSLTPVSSSASGFATSNEGIIYSCNVGYRKENSNNQGIAGEEIERGLVNSKGYASGFVDTNNGLIKNCFTYADVISTYKGVKSNNDDSSSVTIAGFVRNNNGYIVTSFATGTVDNSNDSTNETSVGKVYAFAPGQVYGCYTITKIVDEGKLSDFETRRSAFSKNNALNSYYDILAIEASLSANGKLTNELSISYADIKNSDKINKLKSIYKGDFNINVNYAFGYGSFSQGTYENINYMKFATGTGEKSNPYKVPNLGKLKQLPDNLTNETYYKLDNDMDGEYISTSHLKWQSKNISNVNISGVKLSYSQKNINEQYKIINLKSKQGGVFNVVENSTINNTIFENINILSAEDLIDNLGLLANNVEGSTSISNITMVIGINALTGSLENVSGNFNLGLLVGTLGTINDENTTGPQITNCTIQLKSDNQDSDDLQLNAKCNWTFGGAVGTLNSGRISTITFINSNSQILNSSKGISIQFNKSSNSILKTNIIGGIVGKQVGGTILDASLASDLQVFNLTQDDRKLSSEHILYVGGIVGVSEGGEISNCYTKDVNIIAGNHIEFCETYAGGISGYGGTIKNCKNQASVNSQAAYYYRSFLTLKMDSAYVKTGIDNSAFDGDDVEIEINGTNYKFVLGSDGGTYFYPNESNPKYITEKDGNKYNIIDLDKIDYDKTDFISNSKLSIRNSFLRDVKDETTYAQYYNCYSQGAWFWQYNKLLFARVQQRAYAAGIANSYNSITNSLNLSNEIVGGTDSKNIHSTYGFSAGGAAALIGLISGVTAAVYFLDIAADACTITPWGIAAALGITALSVGVVVAAMHVPIDMIMNYFAGNGYEYLSNVNEEYYLSSQYNNLGNKVTSAVIGSLVINKLIMKVPYIMSGINKISLNKLGKIVSLKSGKTGSAVALKDPTNLIDMASTFTSGVLTLDEWVIPLGRINTRDSGVITPGNLKDIQNNYSKCLSTENSYYYSDDLNIYNVFYDSIGFPADGCEKSTSALSTSSVFEEVTLSSGTYYGLHDNSVYNDNGKNKDVFDAFKVVYNDKNAISKLTLASTNDEITKIFGNDEFKDWSYIDGEWKLTNEIKKADMKKLLSKVKVENDTVTITIDNEVEDTQPNELFNKAAELINNISDSYISDQTEDTDNRLILNSIKTTIENGGRYIIEINTTITGIQSSLGTLEKPFNGSIVGLFRYGKDKIKISNIETSSLVAYGKNVEVKNLEISYSANNKVIANSGYSYNGGVIGYVQENGEVNISNIDLSYSIKNYKKDTKDNIISSKYENSIGGFVGYNKGKVSIKDSVIKNLNIDIYGSNDDINNGNNSIGIGGMIGTNDGELSLNNLDINELAITSKEALNNVFGGIIGFNSGDIKEILNINLGNYLTSVIDAESCQPTTYVGGIIGYLTGNIEKMASVKLNLKGIYSQTSNEDAITYAGGLVGFVEPNVEINEISNIYIGKQSEDENDNAYYQRMLIYSGIGGSSYASKAYADDIIGNRGTNDSGIISKININAKSLSLAKLNYNNHPKQTNTNKDSGTKLSAGDILKSINVLYETSSNDYVNYLKIDAYDYKSESLTNAESYVNGEKFVAYNYSKSYLIKVIKMAQISKKKDYDHAGIFGEDYYSFEEVVYSVTITGQPSKDSEKEMSNNISISLLATYSYISDIDIYGQYNNIAYPITKINSAYLPEDLFVDGGHIYKVVDESDNGKDLSRIKYGKGTVEDIDDSGKSKSEYLYLDKDKNIIKLNYTLTNKNANDSGEVGYTEQREFSSAMFVVEENRIGLQISYISALDPANYYQTITKYLSYIYSTDNPNNEIKYMYVNDISISNCSEDATYENFYFGILQKDSGEITVDKKFAILDSHTQSKQTSMSINVYTGAFTADNGEPRKITIISLQKAEDSGIYATDYIYITSGQTTSYLGDIQYKLNKDSDFTARNELFFPIDCEEYRNNLLSLDQVKENNKCEIIVESKRIDTNYYVSNLEENKLYIETSTTIQRSTYVFTIQQFISYQNVGEQTFETKSFIERDIGNNYGIYMEQSEDGTLVYKYYIKSVTSNMQDNGVETISITYSNGDTSNSNITVVFTISYSDDGSISEIRKGNEIIYTTGYISIDANFKYKISKGETIFEYSNIEYVIDGEYKVEAVSNGYKFTRLNTESKIKYFIVDSSVTNIIEIVYEQYGFFVKEDYTNQKVYISLDASFSQILETEFSGTKTVASFNKNTEGYNGIITSTTSINIVTEENITVPIIYYTLNSDREILKFTKYNNNLNKVQVASSSNTFVYIIDNELIIYYQIKEFKSNIYDNATLNSVTLKVEGKVTYVEISYDSTVMKIDVNNGAKFDSASLNNSISTEYDSSIEYSYDIYRYKTYTIFDFVNYQEIVISQNNVELMSLIPIDKNTSVTFALKFSNNEYYLVNGGYKLIKGEDDGEIITITQKTYTILGGISGTFAHISVNAKYSNGTTYTIKKQLMVQKGKLSSNITSNTYSIDFTKNYQIETTISEDVLKNSSKYTRVDLDETGNNYYYTFVTSRKDENGNDVDITNVVVRKDGSNDFYYYEDVEGKTDEVIRLISNNNGVLSITDTYTAKFEGLQDLNCIYTYIIDLAQKGIYEAINIVSTDKTTIKSEYVENPSKNDWYTYLTFGDIDIFGIKITRP